MRSVFTTFFRYGLLVPVAAVLLVAACTRVTPENYAKLEAGMTRSQVYEILGKPDEVSGGGIGKLTVSGETWKGRGQTITVTFGGDQVVLKGISQDKPEE
ncbi:MAG: outer membrane protein assembly factor BamE domain-containing protein [Panacagrimonas sp.]